jgi:hypothetical protein
VIAALIAAGANMQAHLQPPLGTSEVQDLLVLASCAPRHRASGEVVEQLIAAGADVNAVDKHGEAAIMRAVVGDIGRQNSHMSDGGLAVVQVGVSLPSFQRVDRCRSKIAHASLPISYSSCLYYLPIIYSSVIAYRLPS